MSRPVKGGVWTNTEDEILKVAFMKYGKNQWARISSLLVRKTPKQCKARWYEWIDPSIKKTEWTKEEEEKLLHLAKVLPSQWQTIASIVGRTPYQCLEHYELMLDKAAASTANDQDIESSSAALRALRPGEVDPSPETKPARPDPVDMDEDEKEMLSEARARLANTQGKKAKRKAREKLLEEARRLSSLQKRRELKEAGIESRFGYRTRGMNYNVDVPFERKPPPGLFDTAEELGREKGAKEAASSGKQRPPSRPPPVPRRMAAEMAGRHKEANERKILAKQGKLSQTEMDRLQKMAEEQFKIKRSALQLPSPVVSPQDVHDLMKMGISAEEAKEYMLQTGDTPLRLADSIPTNGHLSSSTPMSTISMDFSSQDSLSILKSKLAESFSMLPPPKNDYEILVCQDGGAPEE